VWPSPSNWNEAAVSEEPGSWWDIVRAMFHLRKGDGTNHDDALLVQEDGVSDLRLGIHHGLVIFLGFLVVDGARHGVWHRNSLVSRGCHVRVVRDRGLQLVAIGW